MSDVPSFDEIPEGSVGAADNRVYGQVTLKLPAKGVGEPPDEIVQTALAVECPDCRVNVEIYWYDEGDLDDPFDHRGHWGLQIAHDEKCPWLTRHEKETGSGPH